MLVRTKDVKRMKQTLDIDMKIKWGEILGQNWLRYLGKEWRCRSGNCFEVRVPETYFANLLKEM
eukprot:13164712-Heterocapsa_arctica.AAC.1